MEIVSFDLPLSSGPGYIGKVVNGGDLDSTGVEEAIGCTPRTPVGLVNQSGTFLVADNFPNALAA